MQLFKLAYLSLWVFCTYTHTTSPSSLYLWQVYVQYSFRCLYASHFRYILFHSTIRDFTDVAPCCRISHPLLQSPFSIKIYFVLCKPTCVFLAPSVFWSNSNAIKWLIKFCTEFFKTAWSERSFYSLNGALQSNSGR